MYSIFCGLFAEPAPISTDILRTGHHQLNYPWTDTSLGPDFRKTGSDYKSADTDQNLPYTGACPSMLRSVATGPQITAGISGERSQETTYYQFLRKFT